MLVRQHAREQGFFIVVFKLCIGPANSRDCTTGSNDLGWPNKNSIEIKWLIELDVPLSRNLIRVKIWITGPKGLQIHMSLELYNRFLQYSKGMKWKIIGHLYPSFSINYERVQYLHLHYLMCRTLEHSKMNFVAELFIFRHGLRKKSCHPNCWWYCIWCWSCIVEVLCTYEMIWCTWWKCNKWYLNMRNQLTSGKGVKYDWQKLWYMFR